MFTVTARLVGSTRLRGGSPRQAVTAAISRFLRRQGGMYLQAMQDEAPVGQTGLLARSHVLRLINQYRAEVVNTAPYASFVHQGTRPHMPPESSGLPYPVRRHIAQHGTKPNPWMARGVARGERAVEEAAARVGAEIAREIFGG